MTPRDERLSARNLSTLFSKGWTAARVARHYGVQVRTARHAAERHELTRFDAPGVLAAELAARCDVTSEAVSRLARIRGISMRRWRGAWMLSHADAAQLEAHYGQQHAPEDYAHYLSGPESAARLGISVSGLYLAIREERAWTAGLVRVQVRTRTRWAYAYCPRSVEAAKVRREK